MFQIPVYNSPITMVPTLVLRLSRLAQNKRPGSLGVDEF